VGLRANDHPSPLTDISDVCRAKVARDCQPVRIERTAPDGKGPCQYGPGNPRGTHALLCAGRYLLGNKMRREDVEEGARVFRAALIKIRATPPATLPLQTTTAGLPFYTNARPRN